MPRIKELEQLQKLHSLIKNECTGSPKQIAKRLQISERSVHRLLEKLKDYGAGVCYDRKLNTYYYCDVFDLKVSISIKITDKDCSFKIYGGYKKNSSLPVFGSERI